MSSPNNIKGKLCWECPDVTTQWPIMLHQQGKDRFSVTYGLQMDTGLNYSQACAKLGQALLHALACEGRLDNRLKGER